LRAPGHRHQISLAVISIPSDHVRQREHSPHVAFACPGRITSGPCLGS
jgi:hypothetical protein